MRLATLLPIWPESCRLRSRHVPANEVLSKMGPEYTTSVWGVECWSLGSWRGAEECRCRLTVPHLMQTGTHMSTSWLSRVSRTFLVALVFNWALRSEFPVSRAYQPSEPSTAVIGRSLSHRQRKGFKRRTDPDLPDVAFAHGYFQREPVRSARCLFGQQPWLEIQQSTRVRAGEH
jgi:hypothetical protein